MKRLLFLILTIFAFNSNVLADYFDGNDLYQLAESKNSQNYTLFKGYVAGVQDVNNGVLFCVDENVKLSQSSEIVRKYLSDNPQKWHLAANQLIVNALLIAFPCK
jgi:hypothetical protein